ncbi:MAG TPA: hypothetical protein VHM02_00470 [Thermoanaerobaculia bacterium]|nr:hypothetical protein [Thermoanaerobaculia bacterium]
MPRRLGVVAALVAVLAAGCERAPERPVARLAVSPAEVALAHPGSVPVELAWTPLSPLGEVDGELRVFVHLLDGEGEIARTFDHPFPFAWEVGRAAPAHTLELYQSALGPALPAGEYALTVGLYDGSGRRWALDSAGEEVGRQEYRVATVRATGAAEAAPRFGFAGGWLPLEAGGDRQILGRRWTTGPAAIEVGGAGEAGELALSLHVPRPPEGIELRLPEGSGEPRLRVASDCDGGEHLFAGFGAHRLSIAVAPGETCRVTIAPGFELVWPEGPPRGALLENLYWRSGTAGGA